MTDDKKIQRIEDKLDKVAEHISAIEVTLGKQHVSLEEHIKRTNLLESKIDPIENHVSMVNGALKLILLLSAVAGIYAVLK